MDHKKEQIKRSDINEEILACPFCYKQINDETFSGCCRENKYTHAYLMNDGDIHLTDDVEVIE